MDDTKHYPQELSREIARPAGGPAATPSRAVYTETIEVEAPESSDTHEFRNIGRFFAGARALLSSLPSSEP